MDRATIERVDPFIYRHRVAEAMNAPAIVVTPDASLQAAAQLMQQHRIAAALRVEGVIRIRRAGTAIGTGYRGPPLRSPSLSSDGRPT
jgi:CBS domain-containing protein